MLGRSVIWRISLLVFHVGVDLSYQPTRKQERKNNGTKQIVLNSATPCCRMGLEFFWGKTRWCSHEGCHPEKARGSNPKSSSQLGDTSQFSVTRCCENLRLSMFSCYHYVMYYALQLILGNLVIIRRFAYHGKPLIWASKQHSLSGVRIDWLCTGRYQSKRLLSLCPLHQRSSLMSTMIFV